MKKIKVKYTDWWDGFELENFWIHRILSEHFEIEFSEEPDYVISSVFSKNFLKYDCVRILYTGENICPDFNLFDYAIGFEYLNFGDRYFRFPIYLMDPVYEQDISRMLQKHRISEKEIRDKREFCNFIYSNGSADPIREAMFYKLSHYCKVNSGGRYLNNISLPDGVPDKYEFQKKHRFSIAFENSSHPGYTTEKLIQSFAAGTIPIYWGDPCVKQVFNEKAMIYVEDVSKLDETVNLVKQIDSDYDLYLDIMRQPAVLEPQAIQRQYTEFEKFLLNIFSQPLKEAGRRGKSYWVSYYYEDAQCFPDRGHETLFQKLKSCLRSV